MRRENFNIRNKGKRERTGGSLRLASSHGRLRYKTKVFGGFSPFDRRYKR